MLQLKQKQKTVIDLINNPKIRVVVLLGTIETGKTYVAAHAMVSIAYTFPNTFIAITRLNKTTAKQTVFRTYQKVLNDSNFIEGIDYTVERNVGEIRFRENGSSILLVEADHTKDKDHMKIKGLEPNCVHVDEVDEIIESAFDMVESRVGRDPNHLAPRITIVTMNPNNKWPKSRFYDAWRDGTLPPHVAVIEFNRNDSWSDQERFDRLISDRPKPWVERYIYNNWDFVDDDNSLFKYRFFDAAITSQLDGNAMRTVGYDVARTGKDRSVYALWYGNTLVNIVVIKESDEQKLTDEQGLELIKRLRLDGVTPVNAAVDGVGVGVGVIDHCRSKGIQVRSFVSNGQPTEKTYDNLRSEVIWHLSQGLEKGTLKIYEGCPYRNELISEAMAHNHMIDGKRLSVESKDKVKERTGSLSPDIFDAVVMGLYPQISTDPALNQNRILY